MPTHRSGRARSAALLAVFAATLGLAADAFAGDVTLTRKGSKVTIAAGDGDESIVLGTASSGVLRVASGAEGTTVVNGSESSIEIGPKDTVTVVLGGGTNSVNVAGDLPPFRGLVVAGGAGDDQLQVNGATLSGTLRFQDKAGGANTLSIANSTIGGRMTILGADGAENLSAINSTFAGGITAKFGTDTAPQGGMFMGVTVKQSFNLTGGNGDDSFQVLDSTFEKGVVWNCGGGNDALSLSGNATVFKKGVVVKAGDGVDVVTIDNGPDFQSALTLDVGTGDDAIVLREAGLYAGARLVGGSGNDTVDLSGFTSLGSFTLSGGSGDDIVRVDRALPPDLRETSVVDGGGGHDTLDGANLLTVPASKLLFRRGFEEIVNAD